MKQEEMYEIVNTPELLKKYEYVDVYFQQRDHYGLYKTFDKKFDEIRLTTKKHPDKLFITLKDRIKILRSGTKKANKHLKDTFKVDSTKTKEAINDVLKLTLSEPRSMVLNDLSDTVDIVVEEYMSSPDVLKNLALVSEKDYSTHTHLTNVMLFCIGYAHYGNYSEEDLKLFGLMGLLHDVGKVNIPDKILTAPRKLTKEEFAIIKKHPRDSWEMLRKCDFHSLIARTALEHHEKLDGSGYPRGKTGKDLASHSMALAIIDIFEALTTWRPYKEPMSVIKALGIIKKDVAAGKLEPAIFTKFAYSIVESAKGKK